MKIQYDNQQQRDMGSTLLSQVGGAVSGAVGGLEGMLFQGEQDANQDKQATALGQIQVNDAEQLGAYNLQNQEALWNYTSQPNQVKNMNAAGLNPALMYGAGGAGGQTAAANPGGSAGMAGSAPNGQGMVLGMMTAQMQAQEIQAQTDLLKAQAAKVQSDTPNNGANTGNTTAQQQAASAANLTEGITNMKAQEALTQAQTQLTQIGSKIQGESADAQIQTIKNTAIQTAGTARSAMANAGVDEATINSKIGILAGQAIGVYLDNALTQAQTINTQQQTATGKTQAALNTEQIAAIKQNVINDTQNAFSNTMIAGAAEHNANTNATQAALERSLKDMPDSEKLIGNIMEIITGFLGSGMSKAIPTILQPQRNPIGFK